MPSRGFRRRRSRVRDRISLALAFFLSLSLVGIGVLAVGSVAIVNRASLRSLLDDAYCAQVIDHVDETARYYTIPTGLDASVLDGVFSTADARASADAAIAFVFDGTPYAVDVSGASSRLLENVSRELADGNVDVDDTLDVQAAAQTYVDEVMDIYQDGMRLPALDELAALRRVWTRVALVGIVAASLLSVVLVIAIVRLHHHLHRALRYVGFATGGAALMLLVVPLATYLSRFYVGLGVEPRHLYRLSVSIVERTLLSLVIASVAYLLVTSILALASASLRRRALSGDLKRHERVPLRSSRRR